jgi:hypothetical protein
MSYSLKLLIALYINTCVIPFLTSAVNGYEREWLVTEVVFKTIGVAFISPIWYAVSIPYLLKVYKRRKEIKLGKDSKLT